MSNKPVDVPLCAEDGAVHMASLLSKSVWGSSRKLGGATSTMRQAPPWLLGPAAQMVIPIRRVRAPNSRRSDYGLGGRLREPRSRFPLAV